MRAWRGNGGWSGFGHRKLLLAAGAALFFGAHGVKAQLTSPSLPSRTQTSPSTGNTPFGGSSEDQRDPLSAQQAARRVRADMDERQKKMQEDTVKLLKLAEELKTEMEKTNKFQMSLDVVKKAEEIERLARDVKTRMKG